jgi:hypothetical protein
VASPWKTSKGSAAGSGSASPSGPRLAAQAPPLHTVDVSRRPDLARRYHVAVVPAAFRVAGDGTVLERLA